MTHPINTELFAEIGRLNILLNEGIDEIELISAPDNFEYWS